MEISGSNTMTVEMTDTAFSAVGYDEDIDAPGKFGASFDNPMYADVVSLFYLSKKTELLLHMGLTAKNYIKFLCYVYICVRVRMRVRMRVNLRLYN